MNLSPSHSVAYYYYTHHDAVSTLPLTTYKKIFLPTGYPPSYRGEARRSEEMTSPAGKEN